MCMEACKQSGPYLCHYCKCHKLVSTTAAHLNFNTLRTTVTYICTSLTDLLSQFTPVPSLATIWLKLIFTCTTLNELMACSHLFSFIALSGYELNKTFSLSLMSFSAGFYFLIDRCRCFLYICQWSICLILVLPLQQTKPALVYNWLLRGPLH